MTDLTFSDEYFMREAIKQAEYAYDSGEIPVGAVIVCQNQVIARAYNMTEKLVDVTAHAEMISITSAANYLGGKYLPGCTIYVTLEPCPMCAGAIGWAQIERLVFGAKDEKRGYTNFSKNMLHPKTTITTGIKEKECAGLISGFFKDKR